MTWIIIICILIFAIAWILLAPLYFIISTPESKYEAGLTGIFKVWVTIDDKGLPELMGKILLFSFRIRMFKFSDKKIKSKTPGKRKQKINKLTRKRIHLILKIGWKLIRSFKLRQLKLNIDTGDVIDNAYLIPVFSMAHRDKIQLSVNYQQENEFILRLEHNLGALIMHTISTFIKHKLKKQTNGI